MYLTPLQAFLIILAISVGTQITRWLPFWLFPESKQPPKLVAYLGQMLPAAMMGLLVVYCLKGVTLTAAPYGIPEAIACAVVIALHVWKRSTLLSIGAGTVCYMLLVQFLF